MTIPNLLTFLRILLIPILIIVFYLPMTGANLLSAGLFAFAAATDWLDGYLARRWNQTSALGAFLDPVADKLIVAVVLLLLLQKHPSLEMAFAAIVIVGREITISALREWMAMLGERSKVAVSYIGKIKTVVQMLALLCLLMEFSILGFSLFNFGMVLLYIAVFLTLWSMFVYLKAAMPLLLK